MEPPICVHGKPIIRKQQLVACLCVLCLDTVLGYMRLAYFYPILRIFRENCTMVGLFHDSPVEFYAEQILGVSKMIYRGGKFEND